MDNSEVGQTGECNLNQVPAYYELVDALRECMSMIPTGLYSNGVIAEKCSKWHQLLDRIPKQEARKWRP